MNAFKRIGIIAKKADEQVSYLTQALSLLFYKSGLQVYLQETFFSEPLPKNVITVPLDKMSDVIDLLIVLGGDGMILKGARLMDGKKIPILGVKFGSVGFLTEIEKGGAPTEIQDILTGHYFLESRMKLKAKVVRRDKILKESSVLNDAVLHTAGLARISKYKITINNQPFIEMRADGLILATPTGTTAYSLAAGGPIVDPKVNVILFTPICPQNPILRPLVFSDQTEINVEIMHRNSSILLTLDGQEEFQLEEGDKLYVNRSSDQSYFIRTSKSNYLKSLKNKIFQDRI